MSDSNEHVVKDLEQGLHARESLLAPATAPITNMPQPITTGDGSKEKEKPVKMASPEQLAVSLIVANCESRS
jgi:hypothetical protein